MNDATEDPILYQEPQLISTTQRRGLLQILTDSAHMANLIAGCGFIINIILAFFTYMLYNKTVEANAMSNKAINQSVDANTIAREANNESKRANGINKTLLKFTRESNISSDSLNRESMNLSKQSVSAQLKAMSQDKEQFLTLNRAFLSIDQIRVIDSLKIGKNIQISYRITNPGTYTAELIKSSNVVYISNERKTELENPFFTSNVSGFVTKEIWMTGMAKRLTPLTAFDIEVINNKENQIFFHFDGIYLDQLTGIKKKYSLTIRIDDPINQQYIILESKTNSI
ncbi:hypothetical protein [Flavobacterium laiguense]|uniref:Uncharacterized protein n=1 Tax=Flavobacterium laiguense TaxID=2169409 RepID=A0A2U1K3B1_9FLAO|nr:hypothetical protein [Flavobacterium laiguense]PWA11438.1 hypothetical protein DB891_01080 [Flavobacterium laiguense]